MAALFNITISTRDRLVYQGACVSAVAPGEMGYLGILANHAPLITILAQGDIILKNDRANIIKFHSTGKGFLEVLKNNVTILLDSAAN